MREQLEAAKDTSNNTNFELSDVVKQKDVLNNENARLQVCTDKNQNKKHLFRNQIFQTLNLLSHIKYFLHAWKKLKRDLLFLFCFSLFRDIRTHFYLSRISVIYKEAGDGGCLRSIFTFWLFLQRMSASRNFFPNGKILFLAKIIIFQIAKMHRIKLHVWTLIVIRRKPTLKSIS